MAVALDMGWERFLQNLSAYMTKKNLPKKHSKNDNLSSKYRFKESQQIVKHVRKHTNH